MQIVNLPLDALTPYARNTRAHGEDDVEQIALSIRKYGFNDPIGVWSDKNIVVEGILLKYGTLSKGLVALVTNCGQEDAHLTKKKRYKMLSIYSMHYREMEKF